MILLMAGSIAYAAIPDRNGAINGCVNSRTGVLRVVDPTKGQRCIERPHALRETPISWNQRGPAGPAAPGSTSSAGIASTDQLEGVPCDVNSAQPGVTRVRYWSGTIQMYCQRPGDPDIPLTPPTVTTVTVEPSTTTETSTMSTRTSESTATNAQPVPPSSSTVTTTTTTTAAP